MPVVFPEAYKWGGMRRTTILSICRLLSPLAVMVIVYRYGWEVGVITLGFGLLSYIRGLADRD